MFYRIDHCSHPIHRLHKFFVNFSNVISTDVKCQKPWSTLVEVDKKPCQATQ